MHHGDVIMIGKFQFKAKNAGKVEFIFLDGDDETVLNSNFYGEARTSKAWPPNARTDNKEQSPEPQKKPWKENRPKSNDPYVVVLEPKGQRPAKKFEPAPTSKSPVRKVNRL